MTTPYSAPANVAIGEQIYATSPHEPGTLALREDAISFLEVGKQESADLPLEELSQVSLSKALIGGDTVLLETRSGETWSIRVKDGGVLVDALRALGAPTR